MQTFRKEAGSGGATLWLRQPHPRGVSGASAQFICTYTTPRPGGAPRDAEFASWPMWCPPQSTPPDRCSLAPGARRPPQRPPAGGRYLLVLVPGERLGRQHEPVLLGAALHDADVVDGQPAPADHLRAGGAGGSGWGGGRSHRLQATPLGAPKAPPETLHPQQKTLCPGRPGDPDPKPSPSSASRPRHP